MVVGNAAAPELGGAGFAGDLIVFDPRGRAGSASAVDYVPKALAHHVDPIDGEAVFEKVGADAHGLLTHNCSVAGHDFVDEARVVAGAPIGHGGGDHGHLQRSGQDEALADGGVGRLSGRPLLAYVLFGEPFGSGKDAGIFAGDGCAGFLSEPEHVADRIDFVDAGRVAVEAEERVAGDAQGGGEADGAVRAGAFEHMLAVFHAAGAGERFFGEAFAQAGEGGQDFVSRAGRVGAGRAVEQGIGCVPGKVVPVGRGDGGDEAVRVERGNADHGEDVAVVRIDNHRGAAPDDAHGFLGDVLDACVDGELDVVAGPRFLAFDLALDFSFGVALEDARAGLAPQFVIEDEFELRFALHVALIEGEARGFVLVHLVGFADVAEEMRAERAVGVAADGADGDIDAGHVDLVLGEARHGLEVEVFDVGEGNLGVVAVMKAETGRVVVFGDAEIGEAFDHRFVEDLDDVGLALLGHHAPHSGLVAAARHFAAVFLAVGADDVGEIEFDRDARAVFGQREAVAVEDLAAHGGEADIDLRIAADARGVFVAAGHLHIPEAPGKQEKSCQHDGANDDDSEFR